MYQVRPGGLVRAIHLSDAWSDVRHPAVHRVIWCAIVHSQHGVACKHTLRKNAFKWDGETFVCKLSFHPVRGITDQNTSSLNESSVLFLCSWHWFNSFSYEESLEVFGLHNSGFAVGDEFIWRTMYVFILTFTLFCFYNM